MKKLNKPKFGVPKNDMPKAAISKTGTPKIGLPKMGLPKIGMRMIKSGIAVFLCYLVYLLRGRQGAVFYSQLAVLWCIQPYVETSLKKALQRTIGTLTGAFFGLLVILINFYVLQNNPRYDLLQYAMISLMIIPIIYTTVLLRKQDASYFSCVVFLSIVVIHIEDGNPFFFVWSRVSDTMIGIVIGMLVNAFHLPHKKRRDLLFISGLDDTLLFTGDHLSAYSKVELNQMIHDGAHITIATMRTPASLIESMQEVHLKLPVIAMDGAVLYDISRKQYLKVYTISYEKTCRTVDFIRAQGFQCFINVILEDMLVIYHQDFQNPAEQEIHDSLYASPYRNYLYRDLPEGLSSVYLMVIDRTERILALAQELEQNGLKQSLRIISYPSTDFDGYSYLKIYNKNASKENMIHYLQASLNCTQTITFGSVDGKYNYTIHKNDPDLVVKQIKKLYEVPLLSFPPKRKLRL
ncbi:MAG: HAD hydrolase family protein [Clostridiaceae bacterium]|nr:HAD hydrolase family protein [Clostridiaceae bacterium]